MKPNGRQNGCASAVFVAVGACSSATATAASTRPVPPAVTHAIQQLAGSDAFLPSLLPAGYRYASWKKDAFRAVPLATEAWFEVTFKRGSARLTWQVTVGLPEGEQACGGLSAGHASARGRTVYWAYVDKAARSQDS